MLTSHSQKAPNSKHHSISFSADGLSRQKSPPPASQNAVIKYLIEGAIPEVKEHYVDSRRELDQRLKRACEKFIANSVEEMVGPLKALTEKVSFFILPPFKKSRKAVPLSTVTQLLGSFLRMTTRCPVPTKGLRRVSSARAHGR